LLSVAASSSAVAVADEKGAAGNSSVQAGSEEKPEKTKVAVLVFAGVELLDFAGPAEAFSAVQDANGNDLFDVYTGGLTADPVDSPGVVEVKP